MRNGIKIALVLLYVMQLTLMFRETLVHAYRFAVAHGEVERERIVRTVGGLQAFLKRAISPSYDPHETLSSAEADDLSFLLFGIAADYGGSDPDIEEDHRRDEKEDKRKRSRRRPPGEYLVANLFPGQLRPPRPRQADETHEAGILRLLTFSSAQS